VGGLNITSADFNNDGYLDILVLRGGWLGKGALFPKSLIRNNGDGTFTDVTEEAGLLTAYSTQTAVWLDYDGDGWLDVFVGSETTDPSFPQPCELFHNNRDGTFTECAAPMASASRSSSKRSQATITTRTVVRTFISLNVAVSPILCFETTARVIRPI
jgi:hypothetical protein